MKAHERLKEARENAGFKKPIDAARRFGWSEHTYKSHENGIRGLKITVAKKYASSFKISVAWLMTGEGEMFTLRKQSVKNIPVFGEAAGGVWLEGMEGIGMNTDNDSIPVSPDPAYPEESQYARLLKGNSVSNRIKSGEYAVMVKFEDYPGLIPNEKLVDVTRFRSGMREHTIKVLRDNKLHTDSAELKEQKILNLSNGETDTEVTITGIVIGAFRPL